MTPSIRLVTGLSLAALLCACSTPKPSATSTPTPAGGSTAAAGATPGAAATPVGVPPAGTPQPAVGPPNAPVPIPGKKGAIPLDATQQADLDKFLAAHPALRPRLRYALALGDDNRRHLVVYDGGGLSADGKRAGVHGFVVFKVLNTDDGSHYDPEGDELIAPIAAPPERHITANNV
ncbi:MAG TPA: hypothetical protein VMD91_02950 [Candidatus Sulfotelmatobacter sp.]|nr:hypothetical protein [Candidatus Sulfotelmatobacter sp.]